MVPPNEQPKATLDDRPAAAPPAAAAVTAATGGRVGDAVDAVDRLDWNERGRVVWRRRESRGEEAGSPPRAAVPAAPAAASAAAGESDGADGGVDESEGMEWLEAWLEAESAAAEAAAAAVGGGDTQAGTPGRGSHRPKALFNPAQEAEKALHYIETIGPAQLVSQLLIALACTSGFILSEAQTDALELPCVRAALARVNSTVLSASEGLFEASSGGGVLLMGDRVAHPISQATLVQCDALCDAVDEAETLLSRGTSLLHKLPGEDSLVEALVTTNAATAADCRRCRSGGGGGSLDDNGDGALEALARYLASGDQPPPPPPPPPPSATSETAAGNSGGKTEVAAPQPRPRLQDYSIRWRLPPVYGGRAGEQAAGQEEEGVGARLFARVTNDVGWSGDGWDYDGGRARGEGDLADEAAVAAATAAEVRLAVSIAEPSSAPPREVNGCRS
ncbi:unnamed protein product [Scytosiphon promiscuus]